jgi:hypothetical protein
MIEKPLKVAMALLDGCLQELSTPPEFRDWELVYQAAQELDNQCWAVTFMLRESPDGSFKARADCFLDLTERGSWVRSTASIVLLANTNRVWEYASWKMAIQRGSAARFCAAK